MRTALFENRHRTHEVVIGEGEHAVRLGGNAPVLVQSMTNTPTEDVALSVAQVASLAQAGSELVRLTVNTPAAARALPRIREALEAQGCFVPLVGDFHYNGHKLLQDEPACAEALAKYRINPGNVGKGDAHERNFATMIEFACRYGKAVRIGVNGGSLDKERLAEQIEADRATGIAAHETFLKAIVASVIESAHEAVKLGLSPNRLVLSAKVSGVADLVAVYRAMASQSDFALHLGLTEAGMGVKGVVTTTAALAILLAEGIGDTIRVSTTPAPGEPRTAEVRVARELLQGLGMRAFCPTVTSCPGCGRTSSALFQTLARETEVFLQERSPVWSKTAPGSEAMRVAVMGCVVNGPGEASCADIGLSLPGRGEAPVAPVYADGKKIAALKGEAIAEDFKALLEAYVLKRWAR